jgi:hypothetical protein
MQVVAEKENCAKDDLSCGRIVAWCICVVVQAGVWRFFLSGRRTKLRQKQETEQNKMGMTIAWLRDAGF